GDELRHRTGRRGVRHHHGAGVLDDERDRREVGDRVVAELRVEVQVDGLKVSCEKNGVTVGGGTGGGLGCDVAAGSAPVLDHHLLVPCFREPGRDDAGDRVGSPARRERHDQAHEPVRPIRHRQSLLGRSLRGNRAGETWSECRCCGERDRVAAGDHSLTLMLAALITGAHRSISALRCVPSCSGVEPTTTTPSASSLALICGSASAATVSACILWIISGGVLAGTKKANHDEVSYPGTPASAMVGTSGAPATRAAVVTPSARNCPDRTSGRPEAMTANVQSTRPAITSV